MREMVPLAGKFHFANIFFGKWNQVFPRVGCARETSHLELFEKSGRFNEIGTDFWHRARLEVSLAHSTLGKTCFHFPDKIFAK